MADKTIGSLPEATELDAESLMVTEQLGEARCVTGELLANYAKEAAQNEANRAQEYANNAEESANIAVDKAEEAQNIALKPPVVRNGNWWIWSEQSGDYTDSGIDASTSLSIADTVTGEPGTEASVENIGTESDLILRFTIPRGEKGELGSVDSVNSKTGVVELMAEDIPVTAPSDKPSWTNTKAYLNGLYNEKGAANGVATLDSNSKIPVSQIPSLNYIPTTQKGVANGVATLDSSVKIPGSQIPSLDYIPTTQKGAASGVATLDTTGKIPVGQYCEEGTWTPVLDISGGPNISYTIAANRGCKYWTIGDLVYITCYLRVDITSAGGGSTGDRSYAAIRGLPFVASSESKYPVTISELYWCVSNKWDKGFIDKSYVYFVKDDGAANEWWLASEFAGINFCGWYKKAT